MRSSGSIGRELFIYHYYHVAGRTSSREEPARRGEEIISFKIPKTSEKQKSSSVYYLHFFSGISSWKKKNHLSLMFIYVCINIYRVNFLNSRDFVLTGNCKMDRKNN